MPHPVIETFKKNSHGFFEKYVWLISIFVVALLCDAASTTHFMLRSSPPNELHPVVRMTSWLFGPIAGPLLGAVFKAASGITVSIYWRRATPYILTVTAFLSLWAAWFNIWGNKVYMPIFLHYVP